MIKETELRIGNYIEWEDESHDIVLVKGIRWHKTVGWVIDYQDLGGKPDGSGIIESFVPIVLTEEWLLKFDFNEKYKSYSNQWRKRAENVNSGCILSDIEDSDGNLTGKFYHEQIQIEYMHQLQNLYFALTGEELIIKS